MTWAKTAKKLVDWWMNVEVGSWRWKRWKAGYDSENHVSINSSSTVNLVGSFRKKPLAALQHNNLDQSIMKRGFVFLKVLFKNSLKRIKYTEGLWPANRPSDYVSKLQDLGIPTIVRSVVSYCSIKREIRNIMRHPPRLPHMYRIPTTVVLPHQCWHSFIRYLGTSVPRKVPLINSCANKMTCMWSLP